VINSRTRSIWLLFFFIFIYFNVHETDYICLHPLIVVVVVVVLLLGGWFKNYYNCFYFLCVYQLIKHEFFLFRNSALCSFELFYIGGGRRWWLQKKIDLDFVTSTSLSTQVLTYWYLLPTTPTYATPGFGWNIWKRHKNEIENFTPPWLEFQINW